MLIDSFMDCFVVSLLAMTVRFYVIASEPKASAAIHRHISCQTKKCQNV